jgi:formate/nitrite transporter FocA (FNT family)
MAEKQKKQGDEGEGSPHLDADEQAQADQHSAPRALVIHEIIRMEGEEDLQRTTSALLFSGLAGGLSMGFSFVTQALLRAGLPDTSWRHEIDSLGYCIGFVIVVLGRQQLFTESTLTAILPLVTKRDAKTLWLVARFWVLVLAANLLGTWIFAALLLAPGVFEPEVTQAFADIARESIGPVFGVTFLKAVFAGWLIALMVWILPAARSAKLLTIVIITYVVSLAHLSHIVAGSAEAAYAVYNGFVPASAYVLNFLAPTLLGNIIGGVALVTLLNHGSILPEMKGETAAGA